MTAFTRHTKETAPAAALSVLEQVEKKYGFIPNILGILAESPEMLKAYMTLSDLFAQGTLSPAEQQLVMLSASRVNGCDYCQTAHGAVGMRAGLSPEEVEAAKAGHPLADPRREALRRFASHMVEKRGWADEAELEAFAAAGFESRQVLEVIIGLGIKTMSNYTNHLAEPEPDAQFIALAERYSKAAA